MIQFHFRKIASQLLLLALFMPQASIADLEWPPVNGNRWAAFNIVIFMDLTSPFYQQIQGPAIAQLLWESPYQQYVRIEIRNFPIEVLSPQARFASLAAICANQQSRFWGMHNRILAEGKAPEQANPQIYSVMALELGMDVTQFDSCMQSPEASATLEADNALAQRYQLEGAPSIIFNRQVLHGARTADQLKELIDSRMPARRKGI